MEEKLLDGEATPNLESLHKVRLTALLHDLLKEGKLEAAQLLGVNYKTLGGGGRLGDPDAPGVRRPGEGAAVQADRGLREGQGAGGEA